MFYHQKDALNKSERNIHMRKIVTFLWFNDHAKEAVDLYVSLFKDAKIVNTSYVTESVAKAAGIKAGTVSTIDFELNGQNFIYCTKWWPDVYF